MTEILGYSPPFDSEFAIDTQMAFRHKVHAVQILAPSENGDRYVLNERGLESVLGDVAVVVISVAGAFRKGKSFLLNFFLEYLYNLQSSQLNGTPLEWLGDETIVEGFHWRSGACRDTEGLWMWGEPIMIKSPSGEKLAVVLLDTQGAFDHQSTYKQCTTIFALSTIVSSVQIYNVVDAIQEDALQNLSLFVEYGRLAKQHAHQLGKPFQSLCFCVRDFKSPEDFPFGKEGGQAYMEKILDSPFRQAAELRSTRSQLASCFENFSCYLLPHPGFRVAERKSFVGEARDIRPEFCDQMRQMTESLLSPGALKPNKINGKQITCEKLIHYFKEYAATFDSSTIPMPMNLLQANARLLRYDAIHDAKKVYCAAMDKETKGCLLLTPRKLHRLHIRCEGAAIRAYNEFPKITTEQHVDEGNCNDLLAFIENEFERYKFVNSAKKQQGCGDFLLLGVGLGVGTSSAIAGGILAATAGVGSAGIFIPVTVVALTGAWGLSVMKPRLKTLFASRSQEATPLLDGVRMNAILKR